jgi:hypothetical protein
MIGQETQAEWKKAEKAGVEFKATLLCGRSRRRHTAASGTQRFRSIFHRRKQGDQIGRIFHPIGDCLHRMYNCFFNTEVAKIFGHFSPECIRICIKFEFVYI